MATDRTALQELPLEASVDALAANETGERVIWDDAVVGLGLRLRATGRHTWITQRRVQGRMRKQTLGSANELSLEQARVAAKALFEVEDAPPIAPTLGAFVETFLRDCAGQWKPATQESHRRDLEKRVVPDLGHKRIDALTRADVVVWLEENTSRQGDCRRALSVLSSLLRHAETLGLRPEGSNPCAGLRRRNGQFKARYLSDQEFHRLGLALDHVAVRHPVAVALIRFLMLTGARRGEALALEWSAIEGPRAVLPDSKTGPKVVWVATPVRRMLLGLTRSDHSARVFALPDGRDMGAALNGAWKRVRKKAALDGVRLHDLRHSYASVAVSTGEGLRTVAGLLGHAELETTMGYAHLAEGPLAAAAGRVSDKLARALGSTKLDQPRKVKKIRKRKRAAPKPPMPVFPSIDENLSKEEQIWERHVRAFRVGRLRLMAFCAEHGLDPVRLHQALRHHHERAKAERRRMP